MAVSIANPADIPVISLLVNSAYRGEDSKKGWTTEADLLDGTRIDEQTLTRYFKNSAITLLKFVAEDKIEGCVYLEIIKGKLYLGMLSVNPIIQNKGIGKALLTAAEHFATANNLKIIYMTVISTRHELLNWYKRKGYVLTGETLPFHNGTRFGIPRQPIELVVLEKHLQF